MAQPGCLFCTPVLYPLFCTPVLYPLFCTDHLDHLDRLDRLARLGAWAQVEANHLDRAAQVPPSPRVLLLLLLCMLPRVLLLLPLCKLHSDPLPGTGRSDRAVQLRRLHDVMGKVGRRLDGGGGLHQHKHTH